MSRHFRIQFTPDLGAWRGKGLFATCRAEIPAEAEAMMREVFRPFGDAVELFLKRFRRRWSRPSWVTIFLDREYRLLGHVTSVRGYKARIPVTGYSTIDECPIDEDNIPSISILFVRDKTALASAASESPMFHQFWDDMEDLAEDDHWLYFADPLPSDWVKTIESEDDDVVRSILKEQLGEEVPIMINQADWCAGLDAQGQSMSSDLLHHAAALLESFPDRPEANGMMADAYRNLGINDKAMHYYERCIELYHRDWSTSVRGKKQPPLRIAYHPVAKSRARHERRERKEVIAMFQSLIAAAEAWWHIGDLQEEEDKTTEAIKAYENAIRLMPEYTPILLRLGAKYIKTGRLNDAVRVHEQCARTAVGLKRLDAWRALGSTYEIAGRLKEAVVILRRTVDMFPSDAETWSCLGESYQRLASQPNTADSSVYQMEFCFVREWLYDEAIGCFQKALKWDKGNVYMWLNLGTAYGETGRYLKAEKIFRHVTDMDPDLALGWNNLGFILVMLNRYSDAIAACQRATVLDPGDVHGWDSLGYAYLTAGSLEDAIETLRRALRVCPQNPDALFHLALAYQKLNQPERARRLQQRLEKFDIDKALELEGVLRKCQ